MHSYDLTSAPDVWRRTVEATEGCSDPRVVIDGVERDAQALEVLAARTHEGEWANDVSYAPLAVALGSWDGDPLARITLAAPDDSESTELALIVGVGGGALIGGISAIFGLLLAPVPADPPPSAYFFGIGLPIGAALALAGVVAAAISTYLFGQSQHERHLEGPGSCERR